MSNLLPYQQRWIDDAARFKIGMFARQTGKTYSTTAEIVADCVLAHAAGQKVRWVILSRGERQAKEAIEEGVKRHCQAIKAAVDATETQWQGADASYRALDVTFPGGSKITALPANPDTARGFSANVFLDEFAFHADSRKIWQALFPVISAGHRLRVTSTPNGKGNKFYDLMTGDGERWSRHRVDIYQAVAEGLPRDVAELREGLDDDDAWRQEYELEWLDEASAWLDFELITAAEHEQAGDPGQYRGGPCYLGNDIGRRKDLWVTWVWEQVGDIYWTREVSILRGATFAAQDAELDRLMDTYQVRRLAMDQTGMGEKPVEDAQRRYGTSRVQGVIFTGPTKLALATTAKDLFQDRRVRIPLGDRRLRADLHSLRKVLSPTGAPRFEATDEASDSHADRAWAAFLGLEAADHPAGPLAWTPVGRGERTRGSLTPDDRLDDYDHRGLP